jgi:predicted phage-related endonuclease
MKTINLEIGSPAWQGAFSASKAPAMLGLSKYQTRSDLVRQMATGIGKEVDAATHARFDAGHASEAITRAWAEEFIGEELYVLTGVTEVEGLRLVASFDGITMDESICWENKLWNEAFAEQVRNCIAPDTHWPQMEHQLIVSGGRKCLFTVSDGAENIVSMWYESDPNRRAQVLAGWKQFAEDVASYQHVEMFMPAAVAAPQMGLPAVTIQVQGSIALIDNLSLFGDALTAYVERINKKPETDQDFADLEATVKTLKRAEEELDAAENSALGQAASIDAMRKTVALYRNMARDNRLLIDKLVKAEKENRKSEIVANARQEIQNHINALNKRIGGNWLPQASAAPFAEAIKGMKSLDSMRDKVSAALAQTKIEASTIADKIQENEESARELMHLFPDFGAMCQKEPADFKNMIIARQAEAERRESARLEAEAVKIESAPMIAVIEHQDDIAAFIASRDFKAETGRVRAILVEYEKFKAGRGMRTNVEGKRPGTQ